MSRSSPSLKISLGEVLDFYQSPYPTTILETSSSLVIVAVLLSFAAS